MRSIGSPQERGSWGLLAALVAAYACSILDRMIISLLVEPIKADLHLTDTQIGTLQGLAFLLIFSLAGLPAGLLVDRTRRIRLIVIAMTVWSIMTGVCGLARGFWSLAFARAGVGFGEAVFTPAAYSLLSESFPPKRYGIVFGIFNSGAVVGNGLMLAAGGFLIAALNRHGPVAVPLVGLLKPWQSAFVALVPIGLVLAILLKNIPEPHGEKAVVAGSASATFRKFWAENWRTLALHHLAVGFSFIAMVSSAAWAPAFMGRVHHMGISDIGLAVGLTSMAGGLIGLLGGGALGDFVLRYGSASRLWLCGIAAFAGAVAAIAFPLMPTPGKTLFFYMLTSICAGLPLGVANAALQSIVPAHLRGFVSAVYLFILSMMSSLGPTAIGMVSDHFFPAADGIRYSLAIVLPCALVVSGILFCLTAAPYRQTHARRQ